MVTYESAGPRTAVIQLCYARRVVRTRHLYDHLLSISTGPAARPGQHSLDPLHMTRARVEIRRAQKGLASCWCWSRAEPQFVSWSREFTQGKLTGVKLLRVRKRVRRESPNPLNQADPFENYTRTGFSWRDCRETSRPRSCLRAMHI